jgi:hypothetical protein
MQGGYIKGQPYIDDQVVKYNEFDYYFSKIA